MKVTRFGARQRSLPSGPLAPVTARILNRCNGALIEHSIGALDVRPGHRVLDIGFGGALSLRRLLDKVPTAMVFGVELSPSMVRRAGRVFSREMRAGRLVVKRAGVDSMPFPDTFFERVLTVQTVYYWPDVGAALAEIRRVMAGSGRLAVAIMPKEAQVRFRFPERGFGVFAPEDVELALAHAGFQDVSCLAMKATAGRSKGPCVILARRP